MGGTLTLRNLGAVTGALGLLAWLCTPASATSSATSSSRSPAAYGQARDWGGARIQSLDCPVPPLATPPGCPSNPQSGSSGASPGANSSQSRVIPPDQVLSNEMTFTRWAYVVRIANIYRSPTISSGRITRLHWYTEDGFNEIYLVLRAHWDSRGREWVKLRIPARPNGQTGWVERNALGRFHLTQFAIVINRKRMRLYYYENGHLIWSAPAGIGAPSTPTPAGHFWINERFVLTDPASGYYPYAFGTTDYSTLTDWPGGGVVGIHGPYFAPASAIPGRISHGCIRLRVGDDAWLGRRLGLGTPVRVV
jgi:L,D-transpeptidase catalytic domain